MKTLITSFSLLITVFSINFNSRAAIITAITDGATWSNAGAWDLGRVPACGDTIIVPAGFDIRISTNVNLDSGDPLCDAVRISISGSLLFNNGRKMTLAAGACMTVEAGGMVRQSFAGGGASESISIGGTRVWQASDGPLNGYASMGCPVILPVTIIEFNAKQDLTILKIDWTIGTEVNLAYYTVYGSKDGNVWTELTKVSPHGFHGIDTYTVDYDSNEDFNYVKLETTDFDGKKFTMSLTVVEKEISTEENISIYPNPSTSGVATFIQFNSTFNEVIKVQLVNTNGQVVDEKIIEVEKGSNTIEIGSNGFNKGIYFVNLQSETQNGRGKLEIL